MSANERQVTKTLRATFSGDLAGLDGCARRVTERFLNDAQQLTAAYEDSRRFGSHGGASDVPEHCEELQAT